MRVHPALCVYSSYCPVLELAPPAKIKHLHRIRTHPCNDSENLSKVRSDESIHAAHRNMLYRNSGEVLPNVLCQIRYTPFFSSSVIYNN